MKLKYYFNKTLPKSDFVFCRGYRDSRRIEYSLLENIVSLYCYTGYKYSYCPVNIKDFSLDYKDLSSILSHHRNKYAKVLFHGGYNYYGYNKVSVEKHLSTDLRQWLGEIGRAHV